MESLAQTMSVEAIAVIKAKRLAMKRNLKEGAANAKQQQQQQQREHQRQADEHQADLCKRAMARERQHRSFQDQVLGEKELTGVLRILERVFDVHTNRLRPRHEAKSPEPEEIREVPVVPPPPPQNPPTKEPATRYNRYGQEKFLKGQEVFGGINPLGSNLKRKKEEPVKEPVKEPAKEPSKEPAKEPAKMIGKELDKQAAKEAAKLAKKTSKEGGKKTSKERASKPKIRRLSTKPIIVVPAALTSMVNLHNAKQLLQELRFVPVEQTRKSGPQHIEDLIIERRVQGKIQRYWVIDNVKKLRADEWDRVAAVFAMGPQWQFKGWPHGGDPARIFHEVCAFHLHFKNSPPSKELRNLQVHMVALPQDERHLDCGILKEIWSKLDHHIAVRAKQFAFMKHK